MIVSSKTKRQNCTAIACQARNLPDMCGQSLATCHLVYLAQGVDETTRGSSAPKTARRRLELPGRRAHYSEMALLSQRQLLLMLRASGFSQSLSSQLPRWSLQRVEANTFYLFQASFLKEAELCHFFFLLFSFLITFKSFGCSH